MKCVWHHCNEEVSGRSKYCGQKCKNKYVVQRRRMMLKVKSIQYKGGACEHCGIEFDGCPDIFDFHHKDPSQKDFALSSKGYTMSWERMSAELDKCLLLCANCHRIEHFRLKPTHHILQDAIERLNKPAPKPVVVKPKPRKSKIDWPSAEELERLVWEIPRSKLAHTLGVSDKAIAKRCTKLGIEQPPRGYWAKQYAKEK